MGDPKPGIELAGRPLIARPLEAMRSAGLEVVVVAKQSTALPALGVPVWIEPDRPTHPLTGIVAALARSGRPLIVCGCDLPFVNTQLIAALAAHAAPFVVVEAAGRLHPLLGRYEPALLDRLVA